MKQIQEHDKRIIFILDKEVEGLNASLADAKKKLEDLTKFVEEDHQK